MPVHLVTNVFMISISDNKQPTKPIDMKIPLIGVTKPGEQIVVLTSSKINPMPHEIEVLEARLNKNGKTADFKIKHFTK